MVLGGGFDEVGRELEKVVDRLQGYGWRERSRKRWCPLASDQQEQCRNSAAAGLTRAEGQFG